MRLIDADALMDDIKRDTKKAIDEGDKVGSFWLGYVAGLVIKQPTIQTEKAQLFSEDATSDFPEPTRIISETRAIPSDDDRVSLSERVTATFYDDEYEEWSQKTVTVRDVLDAVCDEYTVLPSAQPEPQEGHWIKHIDPSDGEQYECSECGVLWEFNDGTPEDNEAYFCPKCGARMKGERQK